MTSIALEVEAKFDVGPDVRSADLTHLPGVAAADPPTDTELVATYFDTPQLDLLRAGITMRRRSGGADAGWHLKLPWHDARCELREPLTDAAVVPEGFGAVVRGLTRDRPVVEVATLRTSRTVIPLRAADGSVVAEFCDDFVRAEGSALYPLAPMTWREWEFELSTPDPVLAAAGAQALCAAGASPATTPNKLARVLQGAAANPTSEVVFDASTTIAEVLRTHLRGQVTCLRRLDPVVRADLPDAVHQMRVTSRRLRSVLAGYRAEFDTAVTEPLRAELGWLIGQLGRARDLEVLCERIHTTGGLHPSVTTWVTDSTRDQHRDAHRDAVAAMVSPRYFALIDALVDFAAEPTWSRRATRTAEDELVACLRRQWRRLAKSVDQVRSSHGARRGRRLHDVRRATKRLRYVAEAAQPVLGTRVDGVIHALAEIQDVLGSHHDGLVASQFVARAGGTGSTDQLRHETRVVRRRLAEQAEADERLFARRYRELRRSADTRWLR